MRLLVTGGGTGGHVYPALAVIEALRAEPSGVEGPEDVAWVGEAGGVEERLVAREARGGSPIPFYGIRAGAIRGTHAIATARSAVRLAQGFRQALRVVRAFRPHAVLATGGYVSVPLVLAAHRAKCGVLIYLPDMEPGLAVRWLAHYADRVAVSVASVARHLPRAKVVVTGYPVRRALFETPRDAARRALGLPMEEAVVLIFGGSRGARAINRAVWGGLVGLLERAHVVHVTGPEDYAGAEAQQHDLDPVLRERYRPHAYLYEEMTDALVAADLVVARAGAATLGEFPAAGLPAVLVPYPYAGQHQDVNAAYLADRGAAVVVRDADLSGQLLPVVAGLLDEPDRRRAMAEAARAIAAPGAAQSIAQHLVVLAMERARNQHPHRTSCGVGRM